MSQDFFKALRDKIEVAPSKEVDQKILQMARQRLVSDKKNWLKLSFILAPVAAALVVWLQFRPMQIPQSMLRESPEMLRDMNQLELWSEASQWSEEDWQTIEADQI